MTYCPACGSSTVWGITWGKVVWWMCACGWEGWKVPEVEVVR
jgi:hypothetical protein